MAGNAQRAAQSMLRNIVWAWREILRGRIPTSSDMWSSSVYLNDQLRHRYSGQASNHSKNIQTFPPLVHFLSLSYLPLSRNRSLITRGYERGQRSIDTTTQPIAPSQTPLPMILTLPFPNSSACNVHHGLFIHQVRCLNNACHHLPHPVY